MAYNWDNSMTVTIEKWDELLKELADYTYQKHTGATTDYYTEEDAEDAKVVQKDIK